MFFMFMPKPSFVDMAIIKGRPFLRCAFAAIVTDVSHIPQASFAAVFPVHGAIISASRSFLGPMGSASEMVLIIFFLQIVSISEMKSVAFPNRVSVEYAVYDIIGKTS